jgi:hypothetical protein
MELDLETTVLIVLAERVATLGSGLFPVQESGPRADVTEGAGPALTMVVAAKARMRVLNMVDLFDGVWFGDERVVVGDEMKVQSISDGYASNEQIVLSR